MPRTARAITLCLALVTIASLACNAPPSQPAPSVSRPNTAAPGGESAVKSLTIGIQREPTSFEADLVGAAASSGAGGGLQYRPIAQDDLVVPGPTGVYEGKLATDVPSVPNGLWRLNPDGTM